jgi:hypothetical protein
MEKLSEGENVQEEFIAGAVLKKENADDLADGPTADPQASSAESPMNL